MAGAWSCPYEADDVCTRVGGRPCQPGMRGCLLYRRYAIFDGDSLYPAPARPADDKDGNPDRGEPAVGDTDHCKGLPLP